MWTRRTAGNRYTAKILVETTNEIAQRVGAQEVIRRLVPCMKDENEWFRYMVLNSIRDVIAFPKVKDASCLMTEAPSPVDAAQLEELGLEVEPQAEEETTEE